MRIRGRFRRLVFLLPLMLAGPIAAATLDPSRLHGVQAATFEVVIAKPDDSAVRYERPLPLDKVPLQYRNDKYNSIGTAFAIGKNRFVTEFNVVAGDIGGRVGAPLLRDAQGNVYAIDEVTGFSLSQDFVVFTVAGSPDVKPLPTDRGSHVNEAVYAVGNALGTGVVIRDGLYVSDTPEDENDRWRWIRFSAGAAPGNGGGPLLDKDGSVIGVVLRKSPKENLSYALPISLVLDAPTKSVDTERSVSTHSGFMKATREGVFHIKLELPITFDAFAESVQAQSDAFFDAQWKALLAQEDAKLFPKGAGSQMILAGGTYQDTYPAALQRGSKDDWAYMVPEHGKASLPDNGYVDIGFAGETAMLHLRKPDSLPLAALYADPKALVELIFKYGPVTRAVGDEKVRITSLGAPILDTVYIDRWKRRWQHREYALPAVDRVVQIYSLPVPDGYIALMHDILPRDRHVMDVRMQAMADFTTAAYDGSFAAWKEFLAQGEWVSPEIGLAQIVIDYGKRFSLSSPGFSLAYGPDLQQIDAKGELLVSIGFLGRDGAVRLGLTGVLAQPDMDKHTQVRIARQPRPFADSPLNYLSHWKYLASNAYPRDGRPYKSGTVSWAWTTMGGDADANVMYTVFYGNDGSPSDATMKQKLAQVVKGTSIQEH
jgi:hypothetical protein